jgi:hypothetical protein
LLIACFCAQQVAQKVVAVVWAKVKVVQQRRRLLLLVMVTTVMTMTQQVPAMTCRTVGRRVRGQLFSV